ncbi:MAG: hypoxanthine phosphoribosyltransferase [bacterium]|nr:hypoxanthine phosphoribosyltransferase [bacterium]
MQQETMREVISRKSLEKRVDDLGKEISRDYAGRDLVLMTVLGGAFIFAADLCRSIGIDCSIDFVRVASYGAGTDSAGTIRLVQAPSLAVAGKDILLVEDIVDTGLTLQWLCRYFRRQEAASVKLCALVDKKQRREVALEPDYVGFTLDQGFLVGYGLDFAERYRNLPAIYTLQDEAARASKASAA